MEACRRVVCTLEMGQGRGEECPDYKFQLAPTALTLCATNQEDNSQ